LENLANTRCGVHLLAYGATRSAAGGREWRALVQRCAARAGKALRIRPAHACDGAPGDHFRRGSVDAPVSSRDNAASAFGQQWALVFPGIGLVLHKARLSERE